ncbi:hypothetical protein Tco_1152816 [Tanacetum coccineum]
MGELEQHIADRVDENQALESRLEKQGTRIRKLETMDWTNMIREQTTKFIESYEIDRKIEDSVKEVVSSSVKHAMRAPLRARFKDLLPSPWVASFTTPPPPPPQAHQELLGTNPKASDSAQAPPPPLQFIHCQGQISQQGTAARDPQDDASIPDDLYMDEDTTADVQVLSSDDEVGRDHVPTVNLRQSWWKPLTEDRPSTPEPAWTIPSSDLSMPTNNWASALKSTYEPPQENSLLAQTGDMATFMDWFCKQRGLSELTPKDLEGPAFEIIKVFHPDVIHLQFQMEECHKLLTDQVDDAIIRYNVSKPLPLGGDPGHVTIQPDFFFNKDLEYLRYGRKVGRPALSISKMKAAYYPDVGLEQLVPDQSLIPPLTEDKRFSLQLDNLWTRNLVIRQRVEDFQLGIESYQTQLNLTKPRWEATGFEFKHDYTVIDSPRAVTFRDRYGVQMIMRFNEIHKFSDGTLQQIDEALDYRVKEFQINRTNPGMKPDMGRKEKEKKDVDRSKDFMFAIQKWLKTRRIFRNMERFCGWRKSGDEGDYRC